MADIKRLTEKIKNLATTGGFAAVGITAAAALPDSCVQGYRKFLDRGFAASMDYLANNLEKRFQPSLLVEGAKSVICLAVGYAPGDEPEDCEGSVARYARGRDYHKLLKKKCLTLMDQIREIAPDFSGRAFVDSAPVMERSLAAMSGLGWVGRNGCLIVPGLGSYVLLCEIICNLPLACDGPIEPGCEDCGRCVKACPTAAIRQDGLVDANRCISYLTIENRGQIDSRYWQKIDGCLFGCDACQEACPFNEDVVAGDAALRGDPLGGAGLDEILTWTQDRWDTATRGSVVRRASYEMLLRNAIISAGNSGNKQLLQPLRELLGRDSHWEDLVQWAINRLG